MDNFVVWFEIPVKNLKRAMGFYSKVMAVEMQLTEMGPDKMALFPHKPEVVSGALIEVKGREPSAAGSRVYLNGGEDLSVALKKVTACGGKIIQDKMSIGEHGFMAIFEDTEGNHVALHSMK